MCIRDSLNAPGERCIGRPFERLREQRMANEPDGDQIARIEGEVEESREIAEELGRQILRFVENPQRQDLFAVGQLVDMRLDVAPHLRPAIAGRQAQRQGQTAIDIQPAEVGLGMLDDLIAMRIELRGQEPQGGGLADAGVAGQQGEARGVQGRLEAFWAFRERAMIAQFGRVRCLIHI